MNESLSGCCLNTLQEMLRLGFSHEQATQMVLQQEKTKQLEIKKRINEEEDYSIFRNNKKRKFTTKQFLPDEIIVEIISYLSNLDGFKTMLVSRQFMKACSKIRKVLFTNDLHYFVSFSESQFGKQIQSLVLDDFKINSEQLKVIRSSFPKLRELDVYSFSNFTDVPSHFRCLQSLTVRSTKEINLKSIHLFNLEKLVVYGFNGKLSNVIHEQTFCLKSIKLVGFGNQIHDIHVFKILPLLEDLTLEKFFIPFNKISEIFQCKNLKSLNLKSTAGEVHAAHDDTNYVLANLERLDIEVSSQADKIFANLVCPKLKYFCSNVILPKSMIENASLSNIEHLVIHYITECEPVVHLIEKLNYLKYLDIFVKRADFASIILSKVPSLIRDENRWGWFKDFEIV